MATDLILGTAGHIDHGKTALVRALSGCDTDRLPEEKQRGITIDLGFAQLQLGDYRLGIVDVPGHERFVRNMLAGATGIDMALLVVAADDSVKPQTREHLEILRLLDLDSGVIALSKCDTVEPDWIELVEDEVRTAVEDTFLESAPIVRTSAITGAGIDALKTALETAAGKAAQSRRMRLEHSPFRMAIDRTFTVAGHGTVVTGSVSSGRVALGDELEIQPGAVRVRVRGLQNHDRTVDRMHRGQRAAINLAGVHHADTRRGQELASQGHLVPSRLLSVSLRLLRSAARPLKHRARVRVHLGTAELLATVSLLDRDRLAPGETCFAQLTLNEPAVSVWGQPLVVRSESPVLTIGGGHILDPQAERLRRAEATDLEMFRLWQSRLGPERASAAAYFAGLRPWSPAEWSRTAGIEDPQAIYAQLLTDRTLVEIPVSANRSIRVHQRVVQRLAQRMETSLRKLHRENPLRLSIDLQTVRTEFRYVDDVLVRFVLTQMRDANVLRMTEGGVTLSGEGPKLSQNERKLLRELVERFRGAGIESPSVKQCQQQAERNQQSVPQLLALAAANGDLIQVNSDYYLHAQVNRELQERLAEAMADGQGKTLSEIRELLDTTRKYAVPYCEYLDRSGFTRRSEDLRYLNR